MHFLPENRMCAPPFATKQRPPIWKILDPPLPSGSHQNIYMVGIPTGMLSCLKIFSASCNIPSKLIEHLKNNTPETISHALTLFGANEQGNCKCMGIQSCQKCHYCQLCVFVKNQTAFIFNTGTYSFQWAPFILFLVTNTVYHPSQKVVTQTKNVCTKSGIRKGNDP